MKGKGGHRVRRLVGWKTGVVVLIVFTFVIGLGQAVGIWTRVREGFSGTAAVVRGYSCLPTCAANDGKFLLVSSEEAARPGSRVVAWVSVPRGMPSFEVGIFDGDSGKDSAGAVNAPAGNWDDAIAETIYTLYADPLKDGSGTAIAGVWHGNRDPMPNNGWYDIALSPNPQALDPAGDYYVYRLECVGPAGGVGNNALKLRTSGYLSTGQTNLVGAVLPVVGTMANRNDVPIVYPEFRDKYYDPGRSTYTGDWLFTLNALAGPTYPASQSAVSGTAALPAMLAGAGRAENQGIADTGFYPPLWRRDPKAWYAIVEPASGGATSQAAATPGQYTWHIAGLDMADGLWLSSQVEMCTGECAPLPPPRTCPHTTGYWKKATAELLSQIESKSTGETRVTLDRALELVAMASPLYRYGLAVQAPAAIAQATPLTAQEANDILQRKAGSTLLDRALQQNLAAWLNLMSGRLNRSTAVVLSWGGGLQGTVWQALQEAQAIMLNGGDLGRATSMADQINNALLGENAESSSCSDYAVVMPPDRQPDPDHLPKAPELPTPADPVVGCDAPRRNQYAVAGPIDAPFYGIRFEYQSGTQIASGLYDEFQVVLPTDTVANIKSVRMSAKAGQEQADVMLEGCRFDAFAPCKATAKDAGGSFELGFMGARDNGDGTMQLDFWVKNLTGSGLNEVVLSLPENVVPLWPNGSYQSQVCP